ncbi:aspartate kinase [Mogibacterium neglectum]|uniref:aspartate kinase n=1 Tax=Mogibacterium neglectum TaxID=114528 RepID=UPI00272A5F37|nr:aspartate kinase [Mogibacterium neglectum]WLD76617.1 aspartate kinase [Mogibacterium neglectum]
MIKVAKFGGSSLSDGAQFAKVKNIIEQDPSRRVVVVSAPGRRTSDDNKVTDLLYLVKAHIKYDVSYDSIFEMVEQRYMDIRSECGLSLDLDQEFEIIRGKLNKNISMDYLASRGEFLNAKLMAEYLGYQFVDSADLISFKYNGDVDTEKTGQNFKEIFDVYNKIVIPGFYGSLPNGDIKVFSRGGSDVSGAIAAASLDADVYENWTDVSGILMVDPRIVENPKSIARVTYAELRELSYMGAAVLHEDTVFPVRAKDIPLNIRNTNEPENPGTIIRESFGEESPEESNRFITGITGKRDFSLIKIAKGNIGENLNTLRKVLNICEQHDVPISQIPSGVDSFSIITPSSKLEQCKYDVLAAIKKECGIDAEIDQGISMIAIVGRQMAYKTGISGKLFGALGDNKINIRIIEQCADEINIMIGVFNEDFEKAIRVLYESFAK